MDGGQLMRVELPRSALMSFGLPMDMERATERIKADVVVGNDGLARAINPVHTLSDGDTLFALATGASGRSLGMMTLGTMAAEASARAVVRAVRAARGLTLGDLHLPAAGELA